MDNFKNYRSIIADFKNYLSNLDQTFVKCSANLEMEKKSAKIKIFPSDNIQKHVYVTDIAKRPSSFAKEKIEPPLDKKQILEKQETKQPNIPLSQTSKIEAQKNSSFEVKNITLDEKPPIVEENYSDIQDFVKKFSKISVSNSVLDDTQAKKEKQKYKLKNKAEKITILSYQENEKEFRFLQKLTIAINNYLMPAKIVSGYMIEKINFWDIFFSENEINLIIMFEKNLKNYSFLLPFYKENASTKEKFLNNIDLFLLPDLQTYIKNPLLKKSLFENLKSKINK